MQRSWCCAWLSSAVILFGWKRAAVTLQWRWMPVSNPFRRWLHIEGQGSFWLAGVIVQGLFSTARVTVSVKSESHGGCVM